VKIVQIEQHLFQNVKQKFLKQIAIHRQLKAAYVRLPNTAHGLRGDEKFCDFNKKICRLETSAGYVAAGMW